MKAQAAVVEGDFWGASCLSVFIDCVDSAVLKRITEILGTHAGNVDVSASILKADLVVCDNVEAVNKIDSRKIYCYLFLDEKPQGSLSFNVTVYKKEPFLRNHSFCRFIDD